jgi:hypothetical protein
VAQPAPPILEGSIVIKLVSFIAVASLISISSIEAAQKKPPVRLRRRKPLPL